MALRRPATGFHDSCDLGRGTTSPVTANVSFSVSFSGTAGLAANSYGPVPLILATLHIIQVVSLCDPPRNRPHGAVGAGG